MPAEGVLGPLKLHSRRIPLGWVGTQQRVRKLLLGTKGAPYGGAAKVVIGPLKLNSHRIPLDWIGSEKGVKMRSWGVQIAWDWGGEGAAKFTK